MQAEEEEIPSRIPEELNEDIPGMEISNLDEPGFEVVTKVSCTIKHICSIKILCLIENDI